MSVPEYQQHLPVYPGLVLVTVRGSEWRMSGLKPSDIEKIIRIGRCLHEAGLAPGTLNSLGMRLVPEGAVVTAKGSSLGFLSHDDILCIDGKGKVKAPAGMEPCEDVGIIRAVLRERAEVDFVLKCRAPYITALSCKGRRFIEEARWLLGDIGTMGFVPYYRPGTAGLAGAVGQALRVADVVFIEKQGAVICGRDENSLVSLTDSLESSAKTLFILNAGLPDGFKGE